MDSISQPSVTYGCPVPDHSPRRDLKIALQSALAAGLCLGLLPGLFFWVLIIHRLAPLHPIEKLFNFLRDHMVPSVTLELLGAFAWGLCLSRISGYRQWWWLSAAAMGGFRFGTYSLYNGSLVQWVEDHAPSQFPLEVRYAMILAATVLLVTVSTGLLLGAVLLNWKASLTLAWSTGLISVVAALLTLSFLDILGIRVGSGDAAMPKATAVATMAAALAGGTVLGVMFSRYVRIGSSKH